ncbi:MAG: hypothetical protein DMG58_13745 [Acidobacteria bacterium]|nr:MAG: hypothetical protein DMG58_13745 [Acidobacteriota bacterium]
MNALATAAHSGRSQTSIPTLTEAVYWLAPPLLCLAIYWRGLLAWFQADDFAWLGLRLQVHDWHTLMHALFAPMAQGSIRPWSERGFFMVFESLFGVNALPFRIWVFLTQFGNLALVAAIARRLTGSRMAGFWAAILWMVHSSLVLPMVWTSVYNQVLCGFFLLSAFWFLLRYIVTGRRGDCVAQWVMFILGFGALEINVVYPALAALYTYLCARKYFRTTLPLVIPSVLFVALDRLAVPSQQGGPYALHWTGAMARTLVIYCHQMFAPTEVAFWIKGGPDILLAIALGGALIAFAAARMHQGDRLPLFCLGWFAILLAPFLPLRDHVSPYYLFLPTIGLAILGGYALVCAWRGLVAWKTVATVLVTAYLAVMVPVAWIAVEWWGQRSWAVERMVLGVARARQLHPREAILLDGVDSTVFWSGIFHDPFTLFGVSNVYLTPQSERHIEPRPELGRISDYVLPSGPTVHGLNDNQIVVYRVGPDRLKAITAQYIDTTAQGLSLEPPRRVDAGNPLMAYLLGPEWYALEGGSRWMPKRATLRIGAPRSPSEKLYLSGFCSESQLRAGPLTVRVTIASTALPEFTLNCSATQFRAVLALPGHRIGTKWLDLAVESGRTFRAGHDGRELGLSFGTFEIRE